MRRRSIHSPGTEIGRVSVGLLPANEISGRVWQLPVLLPEIGKDEAPDLTGPLRFVQPVHGGVLGAIKYRAEDAEHPRENKLAGRLLTQAVARQAANDRINRSDVEAHIGRAIRPETGARQAPRG